MFFSASSKKSGQIYFKHYFNKIFFPAKVKSILFIFSDTQYFDYGHGASATATYDESYGKPGTLFMLLYILYTFKLILEIIYKMYMRNELLHDINILSLIKIPITFELSK